MRQAVLELERMQVRGRLALSPADITACRLARPAVITHPAHEVPPWHWHWQPRTGSHGQSALPPWRTAESRCRGSCRSATERSGRRPGRSGCWRSWSARGRRCVPAAAAAHSLMVAVIVAPAGRLVPATPTSQQPCLPPTVASAASQPRCKAWVVPSGPSGAGAEAALDVINHDDRST
jgi:hypothetical protein